MGDYIVAVFVPILVGIVIWIAAAVALCFLQVRLSRKDNPVFGLIIPIAYFFIAWIVLSIITGDIYFWKYVRYFVLASIPNVAYLLIFFGVRHARKSKSELDKMRAQDL